MVVVVMVMAMMSYKSQGGDGDVVVYKARLFFNF
jgi:hypothetical protein